MNRVYSFVMAIVYHISLIVQILDKVPNIILFNAYESNDMDVFILRAILDYTGVKFYC